MKNLQPFYSHRLANIFLLAFALCCSSLAHGQFRFTKSKEPDVLAQTLVDRDRTSIEILSADYAGSQSAVSHFTYRSKYSNFMKEGLILSTGTAKGAMGPNKNSSTGYDHHRPGLQLLAPLVARGNTTFDGAKLTISFRAKSDSICFNYVFASEEYPEFVNRNANDVFALILINKRTGERKNLAVLPDGKTPICVDEINHKKNSQYYVPNEHWDDNNILKFDSRREAGERALLFQYDGFTKLLTAGAKVVIGHEYELVFAIADVGDGIYDSAIFIEASSLQSLSQDPLQNDLSLLFDDRLKIDHNGNWVATRNILFETNQAQTNDTTSLHFIASLARIMAENPDIKLDIIGHTDSVGTAQSNLTLSAKRAEFVANCLVKRGISKQNLSSTGKGESEPIDKNNLVLNRRVEFVFRL